MKGGAIPEGRWIRLESMFNGISPFAGLTGQAVGWPQQ